MPLVKSDIPQHLTAGLKTIFRQAYDAAGANADWQKIATIVASTMDTETYGWLGAIPAMREFIDERSLKALAEFDYTLKNKTWEATIGVERAALEDDQYGQIRLRVQEMAAEVQRHKNQKVFELLAAGFTAGGECYDGQYFFDSDHSEGDSGTQSNVGSSALASDTLQAAIVAMMKFKDNQGKPMGITPDTLVVPPDLLVTAWELLNSSTRVTGDANDPDKPNFLKESARLSLIATPYLTDTDNWYLLCTNRVVKPVIFQDRVPVEFQALEGDSDNGFMRDMWAYGVRARYNVGYGLWQCAYGASV